MLTKIFVWVVGGLTSVFLSWCFGVGMLFGALVATNKTIMISPNSIQLGTLTNYSNDNNITEKEPKEKQKKN